MNGVETLIIQFLMNFFTREEINTFLRDPQHTATIIGCMIAISGALLGTFLLLRGMSLTSDAISHTVLLGIVVAFIVMSSIFGLEPDTSSPWLIIGAAGAGVATVVLTELIYRSGLVKQDAALGLAFPLLFAIAVILVSRYIDDVHMDEDAVMVGEIGVAWANTNSHCIENCETVTITPDDEIANVTRQCTNCRDLGISPRDDGAEFREICTNCGTYTPAQAWQAGLTENEPVLVFWPKSITVTAVMALLVTLFVVLFYKELKLSTFDAALAKALGFRPGVLHYALMVLVSLVAVGAFDAVGSILVIAFFIIPPAAAYLLTDRLWAMLIISPVIGTVGAYFGYDLARGHFLNLIELNHILAWINRTFGAHLVERWDSSISASMVLMISFFFVLAWVFSPKYGLISTMIRRALQRRSFDDQVVLGHVYNHQHTQLAAQELAADSLYTHFRWSPSKMGRVLARLRALNLVNVVDNMVMLTPRGEQHVQNFRQRNLITEAPIT
ncbi:metal ABC transporter permease [Phototrophicus methaneseepsis]|uniref:Metal ABC transporter permease n=1 Tax=Phototrophicus methaneseepsis TaxID=2710758 RepID=A0A7S8EBX9_9CHLR|nr:metal ABC transporter permease [Phototrophicus methaneseepsis]QPC84157.1 metal ABC transporter permease [Phototrophicus methaneseepsis]